MDERSLSAVPTRDQVDASRGPLVLEFGASWCGHCRRLAPLLEESCGRYPDVMHVKIEDGPGLPLGRSFRVTLWPTLVFLRDGELRYRAVRPGREELMAGFEAIVGSDRA